MTPQEQKLLHSIIDCPQRHCKLGSTDPCNSIISIQNARSSRQVPEPWNGNMTTASFLVLGSNPALDEEELFPSKDSATNLWCSPWTNQEAEKFFEGRFGVAKCPLNGLPYVDTQACTVLKYKNGVIAPDRMKNNYWNIYNRYCRAIDPSFADWRFVVTDFVHCKSNKEHGVDSALPVCSIFMKDILGLFVNNTSSDHHILIFGKEKDAKKKLASLQKIGMNPNGSVVPVGGYDYRRNGITHHNLLMQAYSYNGKQVDIYFNLPAPSGANHAASPVTIKGQTINW